MSRTRLQTPFTEAWQAFIPQVVAAATNLAAATNYFVFRAPVRMRIMAARINVRTAVDAASTVPATFEFRKGSAPNNNTPIAAAIGSAFAIVPNGYGAVDDVDQDFILDANTGLWIRCTSIGSTGTPPAGLDVSLLLGFAPE